MRLQLQVQLIFVYDINLLNLFTSCNTLHLQKGRAAEMLHFQKLEYWHRVRTMIQVIFWKACYI
jgi:hypothetical protein